jgi:hypothetical protein
MSDEETAEPPSAQPPPPKNKRKNKKSKVLESDPTPAAPEAKVTPESKATPKPKAKPGELTDPAWYSLYRVLADTGDALLLSLTLRKDMPPDAVQIIKATLCMRESKDLFFAQGGRLSVESAEFFIEELKLWAAEQAVTSK